MPKEIEVLNIHDASRLVKLSEDYIRKLVKQGKFPHFRTGRRIQFVKEEIINWIHQRHFTPSPTLIFPPDNSILVKNYKGGSEPVGNGTARWKLSYRGLGGLKIRKDTNKPEIYWYENGERKRETLQGITDANKAREILHGRIKEALDRRYSPHKQEKRIKFTEFVPIYIEKYAKLRKRSWETDERYCVNHLVPFFGHCYIDEINLGDVQEFMFRKLQSKHSKTKDYGKNSVNRYTQILRGILNRAKEFGYKMGENPVKSGTLFDESEFARKRILEPEEEPLLIEALPEHQKPLIPFVTMCAFRKQECLGNGKHFGLRKDDIDWENNIITIRAELCKSGKEEYFPLFKELRIFLQKHLKKYNNGSPYVFTYVDSEGEVKPLRYIYNGFRKACERAGIKGLNFHDLRRTAAIRLLERGLDWYTISKRILRHRSFKISEKHYLQPRLDSVREAIDNLNENQKTYTQLTREEKELASTSVN